MRKLRKNKSGAALEAILSMWKLALGLIVVVFILLIINEFNNEWQNINSVPQESKDIFDESTDRVTRSFNWGSLLLYAGFLFGSVFFVLKAPINLARIFAGLVAILFIVLLLIIPSNMYDEMKEGSDEIASLAANELNILNYMLDNLVEFGIVYFIIVGLALYTRRGT